MLLLFGVTDHLDAVTQSWLDDRMNNASTNQCASAKTVVQLDDAQMSHNHWNVVAPEFVICPTCGHAVKTQRRFWLNKTTGRWSVTIGKHAVKA